MSTTGVNFLKTSAAVLVGSAVGAAGAVLPVSAAGAAEIVQGGGGAIMDRAVFDLSSAGFAKNAGVALTLTGSTPITLDLTALAAATGVVVAGDTAFATWNQLVMNNTGAVDLSVGVGGSNPARLPLTGTTPAITVPAGSSVALGSVAGFAVDSTHKTIAVTPTSGGTLNIGVGGA